MSFCRDLYSLCDPLQVNTDEIEVRPACDSSDFPCYVLEGRHGWNSVGFLCNPVKESASPPSAMYTKQRIVKSINLDMCTETLGCETGAMCSSYELEKTTASKKNPPSISTMEVRKQGSAPPPLTMLSSEGRLSLRRNRNEGRLMLFPFKPSVLEAERSGGRLLLRFFRPKEAVKNAEVERETKKEDKEEEGEAEETGCFVYGGGEKHKKAGRCKEEEAIINPDACCVAGS